MKIKVSIFLVILLVFLSIASISYAQVETIGDFIMKIVRAMGLENQLPPGSPARDYLMLLRRMNIIDATTAGSLLARLDQPLTKGIMARILVDVWDLQEELPRGATAQDYINLLVDYGVMEPGSPDEPVTVDNVASFFENPIAVEALAAPYLRPVSPVKPK